MQACVDIHSTDCRQTVLPHGLRATATQTLHAVFSARATGYRHSNAHSMTSVTALASPCIRPRVAGCFSSRAAATPRVDPAAPVRSRPHTLSAQSGGTVGWRTMSSCRKEMKPEARLHVFEIQMCGNRECQAKRGSAYQRKSSNPVRDLAHLVAQPVVACGRVRPPKAPASRSAA